MPALISRVVGALLIGAAVVPASFAQSSDFPQRPVTIVVPFPPGGSMDALGRLAGMKLQAAWGQPVVVDNRAGAGGMIGAQRVKGSAADGHTLLLTNSALIQNVVGKGAATATYDPVKDFQPVMHMTLAPVVYVINPKLAAKTVPEFVDMVKREKGKHSFGSGGVNQTLHLMGAVFNEAAGLDMAHVAFKGDAALANDVIAGHVSSGFVTIATAGPHIAAGNLRAIAVAGPRSPLLPEVPSFKELGFDQLDVVGWFGLFAPAGTPQPVVDKLAADVGAVLKMPDVAARLKDLSLTPTGLGPKEFGAIVKRDLGYWDTVVKKVGEK